MTTGATARYSASSNTAFFNGVTDMTVSNYCSTFANINSSVGIPNVAGTNALNYLDNISGKGRRVDLNYYPYNIINDTTSIGLARLTL